jgi:hypothetical protein
VDGHRLMFVAAADGVVGPTHDWEAHCLCGWTGRPWRSNDAAVREHAAHCRALFLTGSAVGSEPAEAGVLG